MYARYLMLTVALSCVLMGGCRNGICRRNPPPPSCPPPSGGSSIPPQGIPIGPPPPAAVPRGAFPDPGPSSSELLLPQTPPGGTKSQYPPSTSTNPPRGAVLGEPDYFETPKPSTPELGPTPADPKSANPADQPKGIAEYTQVKDRVNAGQRPDLDGLDWLKAKGFKMIVHVRRAQDVDDTDRGQVDKRGMKFISLVVSPDTLNNDWIEEFNRVIGDTTARPVFVYGQDPQTAAVVWYLHLRTAEFLTHDEARVRAAVRHGLKDDKSDLFKAALKVGPYTLDPALLSQKAFSDVVAEYDKKVQDGFKTFILK